MGQKLYDMSVYECSIGHSDLCSIIVVMGVHDIQDMVRDRIRQMQYEINGI